MENFIVKIIGLFLQSHEQTKNEHILNLVMEDIL